MTQPPVKPVQYKGEPLNAERGPGLGCFRFQVGVLIALIVLTPLSVAWGWPEWASALLLFAVIGLLLVAGQTIIFLLRLVAADRRAAGRRRPLASVTRTVGELEDERRATGDGDEPPSYDEGPPSYDEAPPGYDEAPPGYDEAPSDGGRPSGDADGHGDHGDRRPLHGDEPRPHGDDASSGGGPMRQ